MDNLSSGWNFTERRPNRINLKGLHIFALFRSQVAEGGHPINGSLIHVTHPSSIRDWIGLRRVSLTPTTSYIRLKKKSEPIQEITFAEMIDLLTKDKLYYNE